MKYVSKNTALAHLTLCLRWTNLCSTTFRNIKLLFFFFRFCSFSEFVYNLEFIYINFFVFCWQTRTWQKFNYLLGFELYRPPFPFLSSHFESYIIHKLVKKCISCRLGYFWLLIWNKHKLSMLSTLWFEVAASGISCSIPMATKLQSPPPSTSRNNFES